MKYRQVTEQDLLCLNAGNKNGGEAQNRTVDTRIFSPLLYRLSYLATLISMEKDNSYNILSKSSIFC